MVEIKRYTKKIIKPTAHDYYQRNLKKKKNQEKLRRGLPYLRPFLTLLRRQNHFPAFPSFVQNNHQGWWFAGPKKPREELVRLVHDGEKGGDVVITGNGDPTARCCGCRRARDGSRRRLPPSFLLQTLIPPLDIVGPDGCRKLRETIAGNSVSVVALALLQAQSSTGSKSLQPQQPTGTEFWNTGI